MKNTIALVIVAFTLNAGAQEMKESDVPAAIKNAFSKKYPHVQKAEWEKEGENYEAEFEVTRVKMDDPKAKKENTETSALFDASGNFLQIEEEINESSLPPSVREYVKTKLAGKKIKEAGKITEASGTVRYEIEVDKVDYFFDASGTNTGQKSEDDADDTKK